MKASFETPTHSARFRHVDHQHRRSRNFEDFRAVEDLFLSTPDAHWVILGDLVHGPSDEARTRNPELYDYDDRSFDIVCRVAELLDTFPDQVSFVLGNHDHAHIGGPVTRKFHHDEVDFLESNLTSGEVDFLKKTLSRALLAVFAPCGIAMTHASPGRRFTSLDEFDVHFFPGKGSHQEVEVLRHVLRCYGQTEVDSRQYLRSVSDLVGFELSVVVHGHDRDDEGYFVQEQTQFCPVIFGAPKRNKRYLEVDLADTFRSPDDLRLGVEIRHLYPR